MFDNDGDGIVEVLLCGEVAVEGIADVTADVVDVEVFSTIPGMIALSVILHGVAWGVGFIIVISVVDNIDINVVCGASDVVEETSVVIVIVAGEETCVVVEDDDDVVVVGSKVDVEGTCELGVVVGVEGDILVVVSVNIIVDESCVVVSVADCISCACVARKNCRISLMTGKTEHRTCFTRLST